MFSVGLRKALITTLEDIGEVMHPVQIQIWTRLKGVLLAILSTALGTGQSKYSLIMRALIMFRKKKVHSEAEIILVLKTMGSFRGPVSKLDSEQFRNDYLVHFLDHDSPAIRKAVREAHRDNNNFN